MSYLYMLQGLPGSGKTTHAREMLATNSNLRRVNKDDIRAMIQDSRWTPRMEETVLAVHRTIIRTLIHKGFDVVVDDTNLNPTHQTDLAELAAETNSVLVIIKFDTPLEECIRRDAGRFNPVGEEAIRKMAERYL